MPERRSRRSRAGLLALLVAVCCFAPAAARAAGRVELSASPILGAGAPANDGFALYIVRVSNGTEEAIRGTVELGGDAAPVARAPFAVASRETASVQLPARPDSPSGLALRAHDASGRTLAETRLPGLRGTRPLLFDLTVPSPLSPGLRDRAVPVHLAPDPGAAVRAPPLAVTSPAEDRSGEPILPEQAAGYGGATVVLATTEQLAGLHDAHLRALSRWVVGGGTLAVTVTRTADLERAPLATLTGGAATTAPPEASGSAPDRFAVPAGGGLATAPGSRGFLETAAAPAEPVASRLRGYRGGRLRPSPWGSTAPHGLGEVHLLAFDPTDPVVAEDRWVRFKMLDLLGHAWDRRAYIALPRGLPEAEPHRLAALQRLLDRNRQSRIPIVLSCVLLLAYALLAGPLSFWTARRRGRPLRALYALPFWSGGALLLVLLVGMTAKGAGGSVRRLSFIEAGAGHGAASVTRFRGLFAPSTAGLVVEAPGADLLDVAGLDEARGGTLLVGRDGVRLEGVVARPWDTLLVREEGFVELGGGVTLARRDDGALVVANRLPTDLLGVVVAAPGLERRYFPRIGSGRVVLAKEGRKLPGVSPKPAQGGPTPLAALGARRFAPLLEADAPDLGRAWMAVEALAGDGTDWWPADVPALIAALDGEAEDGASDSGLTVEAEHRLIRVVGEGGAP